LNLRSQKRKYNGVDKKKRINFGYLKQYQPNVPLVALNGGSSISSESLKGLLVKDKD
jgi:hypothetical protein